jgi:hypothetical protein
MAQCSSCQFHNMPGATNCGRCGASLTLAKVAINVYPPRATKWAKAWRKTFIARQWNYIQGQWSFVADRIHLEPSADIPGIDVLSRLLVPGWAQQISGNAFIGKCLFGGYVACLCLALLSIGTVYSSYLIAIALTIHAASVYDVAHRSTFSRGGRLSRFLLGIGVLGFFLYIPLYSWSSPYVSPSVIQRERAPFRAGEVLIANRRAYRSSSPQVGDVVTYEMSDATVRIPGAMYVVRGERIDRILAGPNQSIVWDEGKLTVDGNPSTWMPLNPKNMPDRFEMTVPSGQFLIFPSTEVMDARGRTFTIPWKQWSSVPRENIRGRIYWRSWPLFRMGLVR